LPRGPNSSSAAERWIVHGPRRPSFPVGRPRLRGRWRRWRATGRQGDRAVCDLADLLELLEQHIPFDAQTTYARLRADAGPEAAAALAVVGRRLGFARET
jgi:hypothetical protein